MVFNAIISNISVLMVDEIENGRGNPKWTIQRETGKIGYTRRRKAKQKQSTLCVVVECLTNIGNNGMD
jgi:hypothetical protein